MLEDFVFRYHSIVPSSPTLAVVLLHGTAALLERLQARRMA